MAGSASEQAGAKHVGVVNRVLPLGKVADAITAFSVLARQFHDPVAGAFRDLQKPLVLGGLIRVEVCMPDQCGPDDDRIVARVAAATRAEIEMIAPAMEAKSRNFMFVKPFEALCSTVEILLVL